MSVYVPNLQMGELKHSISLSYGIIQQSMKRVLVEMHSRLLSPMVGIPTHKGEASEETSFPLHLLSKICEIRTGKIYFSFMQSTSSVTGIAFVLRSKSVLDLLPLYVDLHLSNMIFLKYFMVLFFTVTKHMVFIMLLLIAMHSTM